MVGPCVEEIESDRLLSVRQVLQVFYFHFKLEKVKLQDAAKLVVRKIVPFWEKAGLYVQQHHRLVGRIIQFHKDIRIISRSKLRPSTYNKKEQEFSNVLDNLFDAAHGNLFNMIDQKRRDFYSNQKKAVIQRTFADVDNQFELSIYEKKLGW